MGTLPLSTARWQMPSTKVQIALAVHVVVVAAALNILRFLLGHLIKFVQGLIKTKRAPKDRVTLEVEYARRKKEEQEKARLAAWKKGQEREAAELRESKMPIKPKVVAKPTIKIVPVEVPTQTAAVVPTVSMDGMNAAKKRELAAIANRKRQQARMLARPMDGTNAAKQQELAVIAQRKLQQDMMARDHLSSTREEEAEKYRKLTSMMATAERDAKRSTESALANIKAKVADVVEQRLESEEKEEEARYAQEWAAAVSSTTKEPVRSSIYSVLSAVVGRSQRWFGMEEPTEEEALAMYQKKLKTQQQQAAKKSARSKGQALENAEQVAMKSQMLREEAEVIAIMEMEEHRQALDRAMRRKEAEEAAAAISYAKSVKRVEDAKRARAINKGKALELAGEYVRQLAPSTVAAVPTAGNIATMLKTVVGRAQRWFGKEELTEAEALAMYQLKVMKRKQVADQKNALIKGQALENAEQIAMKSQMSHEEALAKARMEEEEDRQARATALRRKEAEEVAAAVAYAKSMKRLDEAKRLRTTNKGKSLEQIERETTYVRPTTSSVGTVSYSTVTQVAPTSTVGQTSVRGEQKAISEQEALAMYAKRVKDERAAKQLQLKQNKLSNQEQRQAVGLESSSTSQGQSVLQSTTKAEERAMKDEEEDEQMLAAALRRKQAEERAALEAYKKTVEKLNLIRAGTKSQASSSLTPSGVISMSPVVNTQHGTAGGTAYHWSPHNMIVGAK